MCLKKVTFFYRCFSLVWCHFARTRTFLNQQTEEEIICRILLPVKDKRNKIRSQKIWLKDCGKRVWWNEYLLWIVWKRASVRVICITEWADCCWIIHFSQCPSFLNNINPYEFSRYFTEVSEVLTVWFPHLFSRAFAYVWGTLLSTFLYSHLGLYQKRRISL